EDWLVVVVSDHGGGFFWHGGDTPQERGAFLAMANTGAQRFCGGTSLDGATEADVTPSVLAFLGLSVPADWQLDGHSLC
ncbi:MAG: phosphodiesterase, partial [Acidimicrobiia bacterium]|nr:phosphodiesterase [Acidimicrobiia bacterium]